MAEGSASWIDHPFYMYSDSPLSRMTVHLPLPISSAAPEAGPYRTHLELETTDLETASKIIEFLEDFGRTGEWHG